MSGRGNAVVAAGLLLLASAPASAFVKCRSADGKMMFVDVPPPGCVVEGELKNAPGAPEAEPAPEAATGSTGDTAARDSADASAISSRRRIERELDQVAGDLIDLRREFANAPKAPAGIYVDTSDGSAHYFDKERVRDDVDAELRKREQTLLARIQALKDEFAGLTSDVEKRHGGSAPSWWNPTVRCGRCP
jgi:hypothetical protein